MKLFQSPIRANLILGIRDLWACNLAHLSRNLQAIEIARSNRDVLAINSALETSNFWILTQLFQLVPCRLLQAGLFQFVFYSRISSFIV